MRKLLAAVAAVMAFLAAMTPMSIYLRAKVALLEHVASARLKETGASLAPGQNDRLLSGSEIEAFQTAASSNIVAGLALLLLTIGAIFVIAKGERIVSLGLAGVFVAMIVVVSVMGYQITAPFLVLGGLASVAGAFVFVIFERARAVSE